MSQLCEISSWFHLENSLSLPPECVHTSVWTECSKSAKAKFLLIYIYMINKTNPSQKNSKKADTEIVAVFAKKLYLNWIALPVQNCFS